jgi:hypothetical protein
MLELASRLFIGGVLVSIFAILGDMLKPKSFAGLFGAAPSVAIASLTISILQHGRAYASVEARSMALGAIAFFLYASMVSHLLVRRKLAVLPVTSASLILWLGSAFGLWYALLRCRS